MVKGLNSEEEGLQTTNTVFEAPRATRREWIGLGVLAIACVLYAMDLTVLHLAVPEPERRPPAQQRSVAVDHRYLRVPRRRFADHHGHAGRPHRSP
jgi:hypothetical protein